MIFHSLFHLLIFSDSTKCTKVGKVTTLCKNTSGKQLYLAKDANYFFCTKKTKKQETVKLIIKGGKVMKPKKTCAQLKKGIASQKIKCKEQNYWNKRLKSSVKQP